MNINFIQVLGFVAGLCGILAISGTQLTDAIGSGPAHTVTALAGLGSTILGFAVSFFTGQAGLVKNVLAMPGVEKLTVNAEANPTLASVAVDPSQPKIEATPQAEAAVKRSAEEA